MRRPQIKLKLRVNTEIHPFINHPHLSSIYPPLSMWGFALLSSISYSVWPFKMAMALADACIVWVIADILCYRKQSMNGAWLYALHPLPIVETASSGHLEPWGILLLMLAIRAHIRGASGFIWLGLGGFVKLLPLLLFPAIRKPKVWHVLGLVIPPVGWSWLHWRRAHSHA